MAKLTKADAARTIGVSRSTLYEYINKGRISADPDGTIDTAELLRAGFTLQTLDVHPDVRIEHDRTHPEPGQPDIDTLRELVEVLQRELDASKAREQATQEEKSRLLTLLESQHRLLEVGRRSRRGVWPAVRAWFVGSPQTSSTDGNRA